MVESKLKDGTASPRSKDYLRPQLVSLKRNFSVFNLPFLPSMGKSLPDHLSGDPVTHTLSRPTIFHPFPFCKSAIVDSENIFQPLSIYILLGLKFVVTLQFGRVDQHAQTLRAGAIHYGNRLT